MRAVRIKIAVVVCLPGLAAGMSAVCAGEMQLASVNVIETAITASGAGAPAPQVSPIPAGRAVYREILKREAEKSGLPIDVGDAVMRIESGYDPTVVGGVGEMGLMQVRPETAAMMGFSGTREELARPDVNIHYGVTYLAKAWRLAGGDLCRALMKYRAGHGEENMTPLSVAYCTRARAHLMAIGSPFAIGGSFAVLPDPNPLPRIHMAAVPRGAPSAALKTAGMARVRSAATSRAFWAAKEAYVRSVSAKLEAKWSGRVASLR